MCSEKNLGSPGTEAREKCPQCIPMEETPCDTLFLSASLENPFAVPQDGGGETQSTWLSLREVPLQDAGESQDGRGGGRGENAACARNLPRTSNTTSKLRGGGQVQGGASEPPVRKQ